MDDDKIIQLYWDRNEQAISATSRKYGNYCTAIAQNILGNKEDSEECVNDTYLHAWNSMPPHRPNMLSTFLGKITRNLALDRYRLNTSCKRGGSELPIVLDELVEILSGKDSVEQEIDYKELLRIINTFLDTLSPEKKCIFVRRYWYTDSISDIAVRYKMKEGTVYMTLHRLRQNLHKYLKERGYLL